MAELDKLVELARKVKMTTADKEAQRQSFAYGNAGFENERITREMIREQAKKLENEK
ncbi:MAG TPA: hypothetical protein VGM36_11520 [Rhizomicrobium sp.]|jgi:hypothetical protein